MAINNALNGYLKPKISNIQQSTNIVPIKPYLIEFERKSP